MNAFIFRFLRIYARRNNARRIWARSPQIADFADYGFYKHTALIGLREGGLLYFYKHTEEIPKQKPFIGLICSIGHTQTV